MQKLTYAAFAAQRHQRGTRLLDVREPHEYNQNFLPDSERFPLSKLEAGKLPSEDDRTIALIGSSKEDSIRAAQILDDADFEATICITDSFQSAIDTESSHQQPIT